MLGAMSFLIGLAAAVYLWKTARAAYIERKHRREFERSFGPGAGLIPRK